MIKRLTVYTNKRFTDLKCNVIREIGEKFEVDENRKDELIKANVIEDRFDVVLEKTKENSKGNRKSGKDDVDATAKDTDETNGRVDNGAGSNDDAIVPNTSKETEGKTEKNK